MNQYLPHAINTWTLPGGVQASGEDDQRRLSAFLKAHPLIEQALAQRIANAPWGPPPAAPQHQSVVPAISMHESSITIEHLPQAQANALPSSPPATGTRGAIQDDRQRRSHHDPLDWPKQPTRLSAARAKYMARYQKLNKQNDRTQTDKDRILDQFEEFLQRHYAELGPDPWVHAIDSSHVSAFLEEQADRPGKRVLKDGEQSKAAPTTMLKKLSDMSHFFTYQRTIAKATKEDIAGDLADEAEAWKQQASEAAVHYQPFTSPHIKLIFDPATFLGFNRDPDYFFGPLLGLHLGLRLGDFVRTKVADIGHLKEIDVWYIDVTPEDAKNANSVRRLPITDGLIRAGFLDYVEHVRKLGATYLFPHRDWSTATAKSKPSKNQSAHFGKYMDSIDLSDPMLVFHSFRHTAISAMQDAGVPLAHAMQIAGHEAMDHAVRTNQITKEQARSVHLSVYTHADLARLGVDYPILKLKDALERSIKAPIDYVRLAKAGSIVVEHLKKVGGEFRAGWAPQKARYTEAMTERIFEQARP